jgi:glycosyltransferase involved in cell wall biosynthesis
MNNDQNRKLKILILSNPLSIHSIRWVNQLKDTGWEVRLFSPVAPKWSIWANNRNKKILQRFSKDVEPIIILTVKINAIYRLLNIVRLGFRIISKITNAKLFNFDTYFDNLIAIIWQKKLIETLDHYQPDIVHSLGLNQNWCNLCQPILEQRKKGLLSSPWIYSSWGTDLSYYPNMSPHNLEEVKAVVSTIDFYIAESRYDYERAIQFGLHGQFLGYFPAFGGIDLEKARRYIEPGFISNRKIIYIKGRGTEDPIGRAMVIMDAIEELASMLQNYQILIGQATSSIRQKAFEIKEKYRMNIKLIPYAENPDDILKYIGSSKVFISITVNDGLPASLVEAMSMGAFPIFSDLPSLSEWIEHGENGFLLDLESPDKLVDYLKQALQDNNLVNKAAKMNANIIQEKLEYTRIKEKVVEMYQSVSMKKK